MKTKRRRSKKRKRTRRQRAGFFNFFRKNNDEMKRICGDKMQSSRNPKQYIDTCCTKRNWYGKKIEVQDENCINARSLLQTIQDRFYDPPLDQEGRITVENVNKFLLGNKNNFYLYRNPNAPQGNQFRPIGNFLYTYDFSFYFKNPGYWREQNKWVKNDHESTTNYLLNDLKNVYFVDNVADLNSNMQLKKLLRN